MGYGKGKSEGGQGGKLGHSNMNHRDPTEWVKEQSKVWRRKADKEAVRNVESDAHEVEFEYLFNRDLTEEEQVEIRDEFIETIEKQQLTWVGGCHATCIRGYLYLRECKLTVKEVMELLEEFAAKHQAVVKKVDIH
jgi:uncharacterized protein YggL (DUF469 family)